MSPRWTPGTFSLARTVTKGEWENFWISDVELDWWWTQAVREVGVMTVGLGRNFSLGVWVGAWKVEGGSGREERIPERMAVLSLPGLGRGISMVVLVQVSEMAYRSPGR